MKGSKNKKSLVYAIIAIVVFLTFVLAATYAYFSATITSRAGLSVNGSVSSASQVFTSYSTGSLNLMVTTKDMLENRVGVNKSAFQNLYVSFVGGSSNDSAFNCHFDIKYNWDNSSYTKSPAAVSAGATEYSIQVFDQNNNPLSREIDMANVVNGTKLLSNESISSSGSLTTKTYKIVVKIYNLLLSQNIYNNSYKGYVYVDNISC